MRKAVVTFSGKSYDPTTKLIVERSPQMGADEVIVLDDKWLLSTGFVRVNQWLFDATTRIHGEGTRGAVYKHGFGFCSWKAFCVQSALDRLPEESICLYLDADTFPLSPFGQLYEQCERENGIMLFEEKVSNLRFTRAGCMRVMGLPVADGPHACGRFSLWQKGSFLARQVLNEWWAYSINPECTLWGPSTICADPPEYYRHSTEQSVLSNLAIKYSIPLHRGPDAGGFPVQPGDKDSELYPQQLFEQVWCAGDRNDLSGSSYRNV